MRSTGRAGEDSHVPNDPCDPDDPDDPIRLRSPLHVRFFTAALTRRMRQQFSGVRLSRGASLDATALAGRPLVLYANHPSWWDPAFVAMLVARYLPDRTVFAPIDCEALQRYRFMRRCGLFGIEPSGRAGAVRLLEVGTAVLSMDHAVLCITPQGRFGDPREPLVLRRGLAALMARVPQAIAIPVALEYPFWDESRPEALARWGAPLSRDIDGPHDARGWQSALTDALGATMTRLAADALRRDPADFVELLEGRVGVGGVYDAWRRLRAWSAGRRFDAAHGADRGKHGR